MRDCVPVLWSRSLYPTVEVVGSIPNTLRLFLSQRLVN
jgi:hypothetical protein